MKLNSITRALAPVLLLIFAAILVGCASPTIATVDGDTITAKEFQDRFRFEVLVSSGGRGLESAEQTETAGQLILATMISEKIVRNKAEEIQMSVSETEYRERLAEFPNLEELITLIVENTDLDEQQIRELWRSQIEGRILIEKLAEYYDRPENDLINEWNEEADVDVSENWKAYIPAN